MATLARPVVAAAVLVTPEVRLIRAVKDSKVLTRAQREELVPEIRARASKVGAGADLRHELFALRTRENLRILDRADEADLGRHQDRGGDDWPGQRGHAHLIATDDSGEPADPELSLVTKRRHDAIIRAAR